MPIFYRKHLCNTTLISLLFFLVDYRATQSVSIELLRQTAWDAECKVLLDPDPPRKSPNARVGSLQLPPETRIVGGQLANENLASYAVYVDNLGQADPCTGILVSPTTFMVSDYCNITENESIALVGELKGKVGSKAPRFTITKYELHKVTEYAYLQYATLNESLSDRPDVNAKFALVSNDPKVPREGSVVRIFGYGLTGYNDKGMESLPGYPLLQVDVPVVPWKYCNRTYSGSLDRKKEFCTGYAEGGCSAWYDCISFSICQYFSSIHSLSSS